MQRFSHRIQRTDGALVIATRGNLDSTAAMTFEKAVIEELQQSEDQRVIFDCEALEFLSSSGIRILVVARNLAHERGGSVAVCAVRAHIQEVLVMSGIDNILSICANRRAALQALRR